jgi:glutathione synthase/RimK-type ligase-like ATP-grasp enzyme
VVRVLIPTYVPDIHATAVEWSLKQKGHDAVRLHGADIPTRASASFRLDSTGDARTSLTGPDLHIDNLETEFDVVWCRRPTGAVLPEGMHPGDRAVAERECQRFLQALWLSLPSPEYAFWVNPLHAMSDGECKPRQLRAAASVGLNISPTLFSNNPEEIRSFIRANEASSAKTIYKPFTQAIWRNGDQTATSFATVVREEQLPSDGTLRLTPGIFQHQIPKSYELRATFFGEHVLCARLDSQQSQNAQNDWRAGLGGTPVSPYVLPEKVRSSCIALMRKLDLSFGCFDFIVTPGGDYYFLEVNQMGQFLWIEELCPQIQMLDTFTNFLIAKSLHFDGNDQGVPAVSFIEFRDNHAEGMERRDYELHAEKTNAWAVED